MEVLMIRPLWLSILCISALSIISWQELNGPAAYREEEIITNPDNGDKIISNQLQIIFADETTKGQRDKAISQVQGRIAGYLDDLNIYQIVVPNQKNDFDRLQSKREQLLKNKAVYQVSFRVVEGSGLDKIDMGKLKTQRQGQLDMQPAERKTKEQPSEMELVLSKNKATLHSCLQQFPGVHGQVEFRVIIGSEGAIRQVVVLQSSVRNKKITDCMKYRVNKWDDFPPEPKGFDRNLEFSFKF